MTRSVDLRIHNDLAEIGMVRDALDNLGRELGISTRVVTQLQVAADEVLSNVVKYSWDDQERHQFLVRITARPNRLDLEIFDDGRRFDPTSPNLAAGSRSPRLGGLGIRLIKKLVDQFTYERIDGRNHTTLSKTCEVGTAIQRSDKMNALSIGETHAGNVCIVTLSGRIDSTNASDMMAEFTRLISSGEKSILVDLAAVLYLTSAAFRALLVATDEAERRAAKFALCSLGGHVRELFEISGLLEAFAIHDSREEALRELAH
jgi:anti-anti-sigma factor